MAEQITLVCPRCKATCQAARVPEYDPPNAVRGESLCENCMNETGAKDCQCFYFDAAGNEIEMFPQESGE